MTLLQFGENLSDRRAADAVRSRIDWKYLLGLSLKDPGFDASVLSEFRSRLVKGGAESLLFDRLLVLCREQGFLAQHGRQRTDSTHVIGAVRSLTRLACAIETLRAALDALAVAAPHWLRTQADKAWAERYERRGGDVHIPKGEDARRAFAETVGRDGEALLSAVTGPGAPAWLREVPAVEVLRRVWVQNFCRQDADAGPSDPSKLHVLRWRTEVEGYPPSTLMVASPHDLDVHYAKKRQTTWTGYKRQPDGPLWTFWAYLHQPWPNDRGMRLDYLLLSPDLADRLIAAGVSRPTRGEEGASDHAPAWVNLKDGGLRPNRPNARDLMRRPARRHPARRL